MKMAKIKKTFDPNTFNPTQKSEITKPVMLEYLKSDKVTQEDREWFKSIVNDEKNIRTLKSGLTGKEYKDIDIKKVREFFIDRFFKDNFKKKANNNKGSWIDQINAL